MAEPRAARREATGGGASRRVRGDAGRITVLVLGLVVVLLGVMAVSVSAAHMTTEQRRLLGLADAAADAAADHFTVVTGAHGASPSAHTPGVDAGGLGGSGGLRLSPGRVREAVESYLLAVDAAERHPGLRIVDVSVAHDGVTVSVRLAARAELPLTGGLLSAIGGIEVESKARVGLSR